MDVELLYVPGCPHVEGLRETTERILAEAGVAGPVRLVDIGHEEQAQRVGFLGSPSLRVDGVDVEPAAGDGRRRPGVGCRLYVSDAGVFGAPPEQWIRDAIAHATASR